MEEISRDPTAGVEVCGARRHLPLGKAPEDVADSDLLPR
jgi:hypothetical protein